MRPFLKRFFGGLLIVVSGLIIATGGDKIEPAILSSPEVVTDSDEPEVKTKIDSLKTKTKIEVSEKPRPVCDGTTVTRNCSLDGVNYITYIYHPAVPEKTRVEREVVYKEVIVSYCTLCRDGTYSPSCATGRGACSHHGGVAQWNAPVYGSKPEYHDKVVVESPAVEAYYETVVE